MVAENAKDDNKTTPEAAEGGGEEAEGGGEEVNETKTPGRFGKLFLKLKTKVKIIDHHTLEPNFKRNLDMMETYAKCVHQLYTGYCSLLQANAELYKNHKVHDPNPETNVHNHLAKYIIAMRDIDVVDWQVKGDERKRTTFFNKEEKETLDGCAELMTQLANLEKEYRDVAVQYTKDTLEFVNGFRDEFMTEKAKLEQNLLIITDLLPKIKKAKTNEELAEFGPPYEDAVNTFNRSSIDLTDFFIYNYPKFNYQHQRDLIKFHMARAKYHEESEALIEAWLVKEDAKCPASPIQYIPKTMPPLPPPPPSPDAEKPKSGRRFGLFSPRGSKDKTKPPATPTSKSRSITPVKKSAESLEGGREKKKSGRLSFMFGKRSKSKSKDTTKTKDTTTTTNTTTNRSVDR